MITVSIVSYNSRFVIGQALQSVLLHPKVTRAVLVDNASTDGTVEYVQQYFPHVEIMRNATNVGFGNGHNRALETIKTEFALLLNPDARLQPGALDALLSAAKHYPDAAILAPQLRDSRGVLHLSWKQNLFMHKKADRDIIQLPEEPVCADFLSGAVLLLNMELMRKVGFFDPNIFLYYEDDDLCMRVRAAGLSCVFIPNAIAVHDMGTSGGTDVAFKQECLVRSRLYLHRKYGGKVGMLRAQIFAENSLKWLGTASVLNARRRRYWGRMRGCI